MQKDFVGKEALLKQRDHGVRRRYVQLHLHSHQRDGDPWPLGREPIYRSAICPQQNREERCACRDGVYVGSTTSSAFAFTLKRMVCLGFIENRSAEGERNEVTVEFARSGKYEVDIAGKRYPATLHLHSPTLPMISSEHPRHFSTTRVS